MPTGSSHADADEIRLDRDLVVRATAGDHDAFAQLVDRHHPRILALLERLSGSAEQALDLAQETFVSAYRHLTAFRHDSRFSTWLHSIACNHAASAARRRRPAVSLDAANGSREPTAPTSDVGRRLELAELRVRIAAALDNLDDRYRQVVVLSDMQGASYEEIAAVLDIPIGTVRSRLHRGRMELRALLATT
ncbi:MAG: RNA polymerase sigma factor [Pirellulales bacterium]